MPFHILPLQLPLKHSFAMHIALESNSSTDIVMVSLYSLVGQNSFNFGIEHIRLNFFGLAIIITSDNLLHL